jgi:hypothetical protein
MNLVVLPGGIRRARSPGQAEPSIHAVRGKAGSQIDVPPGGELGIGKVDGGLVGAALSGRPGSRSQEQSARVVFMPLWPG